jgi:hypothetical protein
MTDSSPASSSTSADEQSDEEYGKYFSDAPKKFTTDQWDSENKDIFNALAGHTIQLFDKDTEVFDVSYLYPNRESVNELLQTKVDGLDGGMMSLAQFASSKHKRWSNGDLKRLDVTEGKVLDAARLSVARVIRDNIQDYVKLPRTKRNPKQGDFEYPALEDTTNDGYLLNILPQGPNDDLNPWLVNLGRWASDFEARLEVMTESLGNPRSLAPSGRKRQLTIDGDDTQHPKPKRTLTFVGALMSQHVLEP